ncbi:MAG: penicillin-binding transpeptidase domain-containing protein, partial [Flavobacteriales bacterium]
MAQSGLVDPNGRLPSASATKNKVTQDGAEPGSTFKSLLLAIALELGVVTPTTQFDASKPIAVPGKLIRDSHRHGVLTA